MEYTSYCPRVLCNTNIYCIVKKNHFEKKKKNDLVKPVRVDKISRPHGHGLTGVERATAQTLSGFKCYECKCLNALDLCEFHIFISRCAAAADNTSFSCAETLLELARLP